jgi:hypothetical protein
VIEASHVATGWTLKSAQFADRHANRQVRIEQRRQRPMSVEQAHYLAGILANAQFWTMSEFEVGPEDSDRWIIEARLNDHHHVVGRAAGDPSYVADVTRLFFQIAEVPRPH